MELSSAAVSKCFSIFAFVELQIQVPAKAGLVLVEGVFSQSLLIVLVSSAYREGAKRSKGLP